MTSADLARIKQREKAAIGGPWTVEVYAARPRVDCYVVMDVNGMWVADFDADEASARFVAAARSDVPALVAECERLRKENERLEQNAVRMREYRFAMENIPTDGKGNPLPGDTRSPKKFVVRTEDEVLTVLGGEETLTYCRACGDVLVEGRCPNATPEAIEQNPDACITEEPTSSKVASSPPRIPMPDPTPESVACPTRGRPAGEPCFELTVWDGSVHPSRISLSQSRTPNPEWERFAEILDEKASAFEAEAKRLRLAYLHPLGSQAGATDTTYAGFCRLMSSAARRIARGGR